tara:strand:+ start:255 stop:1565 length:1311 start_codon:yes stop_codon:yes gene_type:complete
MSKKYLTFVPTNHTSTGVVSYKSGNPLISFNIGEQPALLSGQSVRLCGEIDFFTTGTTKSGDAGVLSINETLGAYSIIDQLVISSLRTKQTIEHIRNYNMFMANYLKTTTSLNDAEGHLNTTACTMPNFLTNRLGVVNMPTPATQNGTHFCINLPCGFFNGTQGLPLGHGYIVDIHLAPDSAVMFSNTGDASTILGANYRLRNVQLVCEVEEVPVDQMSRMMSGTIEYNSITTYYNSILSTNAIINFNLGLSKVLGVTCSFKPSAQLNNLAFDSLAPYYPLNNNPIASGSPDLANVEQVIFTRAGSKFPKSFDLNTNYNANGLDADKVTVVDPQIVRDSLNSMLPFPKNNRVQICPHNTNKSTQVSLFQQPDGGSCYSIGVAYTNIGSDGADFSTTQWGLQLNLGLVSVDNPLSVFTYVHAKNTLVFNEQGLQILS